MNLSHTHSKASAIALALAAIAVSVAGCGGGSKGGATPCGDYLKMDNAGQEKVIRDFMSEKGDTDPDNGMVALSKGSAIAYCNTVGSDSDPISNIDG